MHGQGRQNHLARIDWADSASDLNALICLRVAPMPAARLR